MWERNGRVLLQTMARADTWTANQQRIPFMDAQGMLRVGTARDALSGEVFAPTEGGWLAWLDAARNAPHSLKWQALDTIGKWWWKRNIPRDLLADGEEVAKDGLPAGKSTATPVNALDDRVWKPTEEGYRLKVAPHVFRWTRSTEAEEEGLDDDSDENGQGDVGHERMYGIERTYEDISFEEFRQVAREFIDDERREKQKAAAGPEVRIDRLPATCGGQIDLQKPTRSGWEGRGFGRRFLFHYRCPRCGGTTAVRASAWRGKQPVPSVGAVRCGALHTPRVDALPAAGKPVSDAELVEACNAVSRLAGDRKGPILSLPPTAEEIQAWQRWNDRDGEWDFLDRADDADAMVVLRNSWDLGESWAESDPAASVREWIAQGRKAGRKVQTP
jgi:hypothetical protein